MFFSPENIEQLYSEYSNLNSQFERILYAGMGLKLSNPSSLEYMQQGFLRRITTLKRCVDNIFTLHPPERTEKPTGEELDDLTINIQSFVFNCYGCIDNLAWVWVKEKGYGCSNKKVSFENKAIKMQLSSEFQTCLEELEEWVKYLKDFRHALAHRIPLYIPPFFLTEIEAQEYHQLEDEVQKAIREMVLDLDWEIAFSKIDKLKEKQKKLGLFRPLFMHSFSESDKQVIFHAQILVDWKAVIKIAKALIKELSET